MVHNINDSEELLHVLGSITPLSGPFQERIAQQIVTEEVRAKHILLRPGEIARRIYYIKEGFLRAFIIDENGKECTTWLMGKYDLMISVYSFLPKDLLKSTSKY